MNINFKLYKVFYLTHEFIEDKLNKSLFEIKANIKIPKRKLGYAIKSNFIPSFTVSKFIDILINI